MDLALLLLTTGAHSALIVIPDSLKVHKFETAGDFMASCVSMQLQ